MCWGKDAFVLTFSDFNHRSVEPQE